MIYNRNNKVGKIIHDMNEKLSTELEILKKNQKKKKHKNEELSKSPEKYS